MSQVVSIIVPIYKIRKEYLEKCITSLVGQTYKDVEILLVDDGSPDNCGAICDEFALQYESIKVLHQKNQGVSVARNNGLDNITGEYVMFVDADDWIEPDCIEVTLKDCIARDVDMLFFQHVKEGKTTQVYNAKPRSIRKEDVKNIQLNILRGKRSLWGIDFKPPWGKIVKRSLCEDFGLRFPVGIRKTQDVIYNLYLFEHLRSAYYLDYVGYHYRENSESINHRYNPEMSKVMLDVLECAEKFVLELHPGDEEFRTALGYRAMRMLATIEDTYTFHEDSQLTRQEILNITRAYLKSPLVDKYMKTCSLGDIKGMKSKIRYLLEKEKSLFFYYLYCSLAKGRTK